MPNNIMYILNKINTCVQLNISDLYRKVLENNIMVFYVDYLDATICILVGTKELKSYKNDPSWACVVESREIDCTWDKFIDVLSTGKNIEYIKLIVLSNLFIRL